MHRVILFLLISTHSMGAATPDISPTSRVLALSAPRPDYPSEARRQHLEGVGRYLMIIDTDTGLVTSVRVIRSSGYGILDRAAIDAFSRWKIKPHTVSRLKAPVTWVTSKEKVAAYNRAIVPYVAKARATYPEAKKRFLAGLSPGYRLWVRVPLSDGSGKSEDSNIAVEKISDGKITGTIRDEPTLVSRYKSGQRITFPETQIENWFIEGPDGTEDGSR